MKLKLIQDSKRLVIKIGSSLLIHNNKFDIKWLESFVDDIIFLKKKNIKVLIVVSGSVSLGKSYLNIKKKTSYSRKASLCSLRTSNSNE